MSRESYLAPNSSDKKYEMVPTMKEFPKVVGYDGDWGNETYTVNIPLTPYEKYVYKPTTYPQEDINMATTTRRVVEVQLIDDDKGLEVENSLVWKVEGIVTEDDDSTTIQELLMKNNLVEILAQHNQVRAETPDLDTLKRTGNTVNLQPVKLKNLRWVVK